MLVGHKEESAVTIPRTTDDVVVEAPFKVEESEESELNQNLLQQDSDQDFSDDNAEGVKNEAFEEGSEDLNIVSVVNPILFTEHIPVMGRVPLSK